MAHHEGAKARRRAKSGPNWSTPSNLALHILSECLPVRIDIGERLVFLRVFVPSWW